MINNFKTYIVILNWNRLADTIECLTSLEKLDYSNYGIIIIDNASTDGSPEKIKQLFPSIILIKNTANLGFAGGNNVGIKYALEHGAEYVWLLNNDTIVEPHCLSQLVSAAEQDARIGLISPVIYYYSNHSKIQFCGAFFDMDNFRITEAVNLSDSAKLRPDSIALWGTALLIKRVVIEKIGLLNEKLFAYWEDTDYSFRTLKAGYLNKIQDSSMIFHKLEMKDKGDLVNKPPYFFYYLTRNEFWFYMRNVNFSKKLSFVKLFLSNIFSSLALYKKHSYRDAIDGTSDGIMSALFNRGGNWNRRIKMPVFLKSILMHPYFFLSILEGDISKLASNTRKFLKSRHPIPNLRLSDKK